MNIQYSTRISNTARYAFAELSKKVADLQAQGMHVIDFGVGDPKDTTPDFVINKLTPAAHRHAAAGYPSYTGSLTFRTACARYMKRAFDVDLDPETEVTCTIGSKEAIFHFPFGFIDPGHLVICPTPGYPPYQTGTVFAGGVPYFVPLLREHGFLIDFERIPSEICKRAKVIWINYPNSPTGALAPRTWMEDLIAWAHRHDLIIAADEGCYIDIYFDEKPRSILEIATEGIITFYSLSKRSNMTGYRVGFCAGDARLIAGLRRVKTNLDSGTPYFIQAAAVAALEDEHHLHQMRQRYRIKRDLLLAALGEAGLPACQSKATFYLWQRAPEGMTGLELTQKLLELGIVVTPGTWLTNQTEQGINPGENYIRFALVPPVEDVEEATKRLKALSLCAP